STVWLHSATRTLEYRPASAPATAALRGDSTIETSALAALRPSTIAAVIVPEPTNPNLMPRARSRSPPRIRCRHAARYRLSCSIASATIRIAKARLARATTQPANPECHALDAV